ncbi:MAG: hypothetical protein P9M06_05675 [Candidatus Saelkia tenebricola]|nr:hypothetical protein [Candidatus Saelkia tenebricola]
MKKLLALLVLVGLVSAPVFAIELTVDNNQGISVGAGVAASTAAPTAPVDLSGLDMDLELCSATSVSVAEIEQMARDARVIALLDKASLPSTLTDEQKLDVHKYILVTTLQAAGIDVAAEAVSSVAGGASLITNPEMTAAQGSFKTEVDSDWDAIQTIRSEAQRRARANESLTPEQQIALDSTSAEDYLR